MQHENDVVTVASCTCSVRTTLWQWRHVHAAWERRCDNGVMDMQHENDVVTVGSCTCSMRTTLWQWRHVHAAWERRCDSGVMYMQHENDVVTMASCTCSVRTTLWQWRHVHDAWERRCDSGVKYMLRENDIASCTCCVRLTLWQWRHVHAAWERRWSSCTCKVRTMLSQSRHAHAAVCQHNLCHGRTCGETAYEEGLGFTRTWASDLGYSCGCSTFSWPTRNSVMKVAAGWRLLRASWELAYSVYSLYPPTCVVGGGVARAELSTSPRDIFAARAASI